MNQYVLSLDKKADLYLAYLYGASPIEAATKLKLSVLTVIRHYLQFDERN